MNVQRGFASFNWIVVVAWVCIALTCAAQAARPCRPNVIFILADDLGYGDTGVTWQSARAEGLPRISTPNLDRLAREGAVMPNHYCAAPVCAPSRASILTGRVQGECSLRDNCFDRAFSETNTLGTVMRDAGYATWAKGIGVSIPRGFAYALLDGGKAGPIACFSLHLKSNMNRSGSAVEGQKNIYKREAAAAQVLSVVRKMRDAFPDRELRVVVGGDFNTNDEDLEYVSEATLRSFYGAHFRSCFRDLKKEQKVTRPGANGFPDMTFDYILYRGFERIVSRKIYPGKPISDHNLVALRLK